MHPKIFIWKKYKLTLTMQIILEWMWKCSIPLFCHIEFGLSHAILFILPRKPCSHLWLQLSPPEYSLKPICNSHFSVELQPQPSKCQLNICACIFYRHFKLSLLRKNLSSIPHLNHFTDFYISRLYSYLNFNH